MTLMDKISIFVEDYLWGMPMVILLVGTAIVTMACCGFFPITRFGYIMKTAFHGLFKPHEGEEKSNGILNTLEATSMALGTTIGVGNISGVATAIAVGGPGAVFWMWVSALFGMALKMAEITLALFYRQRNSEGETFGSPLYYIEKGIGQVRGWKKISIVLCFITVLGGVSTFFVNIQTYTVAEAVGNTFKFDLLVVAIVYTVFLYLMIGNGVKGLGKITSILIPLMCIFYIVAGIVIILLNLTQVPGMIGTIVKSAFTGSAALGGFMGAAVVQAVKIGVSRAVFSNEAGWGTAPTIHASAKVDHPVKQGIMGVFEVFMDTFVICTVTCFVVLLSGEWTTGLDGATLTLSAFETVIGYPGRVVLAISVFIFGLTTSSGIFAQLEVTVRYLVEKFHIKGRAVLIAYKWLYPLPSLIMVIVAYFYGMPGTQLWILSDSTTAIPVFANCIAVLILIPEFRKLVADYRARVLHQGTADPSLKPFYDTNDVE